MLRGSCGVNREGGTPGLFVAALTPNPETLKTPKTLDNTYNSHYTLI